MVAKELHCGPEVTAADILDALLLNAIKEYVQREISGLPGFTVRCFNEPGNSPGLIYGKRPDLHAFGDDDKLGRREIVGETELHDGLARPETVDQWRALLRYVREDPRREFHIAIFREDVELAVEVFRAATPAGVAPHSQVGMTMVNQRIYEPDEVQATSNVFDAFFRIRVDGRGRIVRTDA